MMMTPEQQAELQAKTQPLLEKLVEVLNELEQISNGQPVIVHEARITTVGGTVEYRTFDQRWEIEPR